MGHANLSNLSELFVNLLYAKGRLTLAQAVETAIRRKETVHASEGEYEDDGMLGVGFMDILHLLNSRTGREYQRGGRWLGPWVVPDWDVCKVPKGVVPGLTAKNLLAQCRKVQVAYIPINTVWESKDLFGVCADAVMDDGHGEWADLIRGFPLAYTSYALWDSDDEEYDNSEHCPDGSDWWEHFDKIRWVFAPGWRKKYRDVPRLGDVTH